MQEEETGLETSAAEEIRETAEEVAEQAQEAPPVPKANVQLRPSAQPITEDGEVNAGMDKNPILFPSKEVQRAGWYHPRAQDILNLFGDRYAEVKPKA